MTNPPFFRLQHRLQVPVTAAICHVLRDEGVPRLVQRPLEIAWTGKISKRCARFTLKKYQQDQPTRLGSR
ncbi:hypothetical protein L3X38_019256 [Prunus dulcis]|uniref:Uncharacterized protein n=1 Tax=Prunus dulcis TaxID=3755 RepID=A0AAD4ZAW2_PRUDU|nr:hypothetical protein L3X38_019256 [Prunus dulcis]